MTKLQLTLTDQETRIFSYKASELGYDLTRFIKYQLTRLAEKYLSDVPCFPMSPKTEKLVLESQRAYKEKKLKKTLSLDKLFK